MEQALFTSYPCIADLLRAYPQVIPVFLRHGMACVGCPMAIFETLKSALSIYGIAPDDFLSELRQAAESNPATGEETK